MAWWWWDHDMLIMMMRSWHDDDVVMAWWWWDQDIHNVMIMMRSWHDADDEIMTYMMMMRSWQDADEIMMTWSWSWHTWWWWGNKRVALWRGRLWVQPFWLWETRFWPRGIITQGSRHRLPILFVWVFCYNEGIIHHATTAIEVSHTQTHAASNMSFDDFVDLKSERSRFSMPKGKPYNDTCPGRGVIDRS